MTKKNLSDLLKQEASNPDSADATLAAATPDSEEIEAEAIAQKAAPARSPSRLTKADLEKKLAQLEAALKTSEQAEAALTVKVQDLEQDLATQQAHTLELKTALEASQSHAADTAEKLKKASEELAEAKQVILKMTEAAKQPAAPAAPAPAPASPKQPPQKTAPAKPTLSVKMPHGNDIYRGSRRLPPPKAIPDYAIEHGEQKNRMLSNDEIGWVD